MNLQSLVKFLSAGLRAFVLIALCLGPGGCQNSSSVPPALKVDACANMDCGDHGPCGFTAQGEARCLGTTVDAPEGMMGVVASDHASGIRLNRKRGVAPLAIFFDATSTTCEKEGCNSFHELHYKWGFGDPSSGTWSTSGKSKDVAFGPVAAHVYEKPGTYTVVLTVSEGSVDRRLQQQIIVEDPEEIFSANKTTCVSHRGNFAGCPAGANKVQSDNVPQSIAACLKGAGASRCLLRRGEVFARHGGISISKSAPVLIASFGDPTAPRPEFHFNGRAVRLGEGVRDARVVDLHFVGQGDHRSRIFVAQRRFDNLLVMNTSAEARSVHAGLSFPASVLKLKGDKMHEGLFFVENDWRAFGHGAGGNIVAVVSNQLAVLGNTLLDSSNGEHVMRIFHGEKAVISNNHMGICAQRKAVLTLRSLDQQVAREFVVSDNLIWGNSDWPVHLVGKNASRQVARGEDYILERNFIRRAPHAKGDGIQRGIIVDGEAAHRVTLRNNIVWMQNWQASVALTGGDWVYNNTCYTTDNSGSCSEFSRSPAHNNLMYAPNFTDDDSRKIASDPQRGQLLVKENPFRGPLRGNNLTPTDFLLSPDSVAVGAGVEDKRLKIDFMFNERPEARPDAGAFQTPATP